MCAHLVVGAGTRWPEHSYAGGQLKALLYTRPVTVPTCTPNASTSTTRAAPNLPCTAAQAGDGGRQQHRLRHGVEGAGGAAVREQALPSSL